MIAVHVIHYKVLPHGVEVTVSRMSRDGKETLVRSVENMEDAFAAVYEMTRQLEIRQ